MLLLSLNSCCCVLVDVCREGVDIQDAYKLLSPTLGAHGASIIFALALLASGQNSTITGTLAGQVVMEGFLQVGDGQEKGGSP
jgi:NRAMP (natural resistance-associated macrophage protein)-like metal ion transporter